jgi:tetratricopeptide (TPR) repeat protein
LSGDAVDDAHHWQQLQTLFDRFEQTPLDELDSVLNSACADESLRHRVLDLIRAARSMAADESTQAPVARAPEQIVGSYRLLREIGRGGIGTVFLAERIVDGVVLRSALKMLAQHAVDASFVERFQREQQNLAALDHPHITRLLDAGWTDSGQPFLVMEYVEGDHLDAYCNKHSLPVAKRLQLFLQICDAVSNAHRNLIVHLDLKPSNVLVSSAGAVKLLDFGTSKLINPDNALTATVIATPAYASPEQLLNQPVSTASDVYGMGAVLYELLAGRAPFGKISAAVRIEAAAREVEPETIDAAVTPEAASSRASTEKALRQVLRGDLSAIVAKCLRSRPKDRYSSVEALSDEVHRYLACEPILGRRQTLAYKTGKFLRRHRAGASVGIVVGVALAGSLGYAWLKQQDALREAERSVRMQTFMFSLFKMANPSYTGKPVASVPEFLRAGMEKLPNYIHEPADLREAQLGLAESMYESGDYQSARAGLARIIAASDAPSAVADRAEAEAYAGAIEFRLGHVPEARGLAADAVRLAQSPRVSARVRVLSEIFLAANEDDLGFRSEANLAMLRAAVQESQDRHLDVSVRALALNSLGSDLDLRGDIPAAAATFKALLALYGDDQLSLCERSEAVSWLAWLDDKQGIPGSGSLYRQAYDGYVACAGADSRGALTQLPYLAGALIKTGRADEAVPMLENSLPVWRRVQGDDPDATGMLFYLSRGYAALGRYTDAEAAANELFGRLAGKVADTDRTLGMAHLVLAQALVGEGRRKEALPHAVTAQALLSDNFQSVYGAAILEEANTLLNHLRESPPPAPRGK